MLMHVYLIFVFFLNKIKIVNPCAPRTLFALRALVIKKEEEIILEIMEPEKKKNIQSPAAIRPAQNVHDLSRSGNRERMNEIAARTYKDDTTFYLSGLFLALVQLWYPGMGKLR
jgi:hypothetical protein